MRAELGRASPFSSVVAANGHGISDDFGSSVERTAKLHPLWRWEVRLVCAAWWGALDGVQLWFQLVVRLSVL
jgi:hypothetical protein